MSVDWQQIKEIFYSLGSLAGIIALARPILESRHELDRERLSEIYKILNEKDLEELSKHLWRERRFPALYISKLTSLDREIINNNKLIRFSGPLKSKYRNEINLIYQSIQSFLEEIGGPYWSVTLVHHGGTIAENYYAFKKDEFQNDHENKSEYKAYLDSVENHVILIRESFRRIQVLSELHFLESFFAFIILPSRFREVKL